MKHVAIPVTNNRLSEYFGECDHYLIYNTGRKVVSKKTLPALPLADVAAQLPAWLEKYRITDVISFKINPKIITLFISRKVNLYVGIPFESPDNLIEDYLQGKLESDQNIIKEITNNQF